MKTALLLGTVALLWVGCSPPSEPDTAGTSVDASDAAPHTKNKSETAAPAQPPAPVTPPASTPVAAAHGESAAGDAGDLEIDPVTGMKIAENWELVRNHCIICHSSQQFLRQRGTRRTWESVIHWMQEEQGLWKLDPETEDKIVTYLAENYAPGETHRREPIAATLLPPNPYVSQLKQDFEQKRSQGVAPTGAAN